MTNRQSVPSVLRTTQALYLAICEGGRPLKDYRAPHANRPTPPRPHHPHRPRRPGLLKGLRP